MCIQEKEIIIVDDEPISALLLKRHLIDEGYNVTYYNSPLKAIEILKNKFIPLVISDINMPDMGGLAFLRWINENTPKTDVIFITAYSTPEIKNSSLQRGIAQFFEKPLDFKKITEYISSKFQSNKFEGEIKDINLTEFIKMLLISNKKRRIIIKDTDNQEATIYIHEGKIVEAIYKDLKGEEALNKIILLNNANFHDEEWEQPENFSMSKGQETLSINPSNTLKNRTSNLYDPNNPAILKLKSNKKILIVDNDKPTRLIIEKYFNQHGYNSVSKENSNQAINALTQEHFDLILIDINMPDINGIDFLLWVKNNFSRTKVILMTTPNNTLINPHGALACLEKPINLIDLDKFIVSQLIEGRFSGYLRDISLLDYIKILILDSQTKKIRVNDVIIKKFGTIYIKDGEIISSDYDGLYGEDAFYKILKMEYGIFNDLEWSEPSENNIKTSTEKIMIEAETINIEENLLRKNRFRENRDNNLKNILQLDSKKFDSIENIDDEKLGVFGLYIGKSTKHNVIETMKKYSSVDGKSQIMNQLISYEDISLRILFNEKGLIDEFNFGEHFKGLTYSGLAIGDTLQRAIEIYGKPITVTIKGAVWKQLACFSKGGNIITSIRLRRENFFENIATHEIKLSTTERKALDSTKNSLQIPEFISLDYTIYKDNVMGVFLGKSDKEQVKAIMSRYSKSFNKFMSDSTRFIYDDINANIIFNANGVVREISLGKNYKGKTSKGLSIGDSVDDAVALYGAPSLESNENILLWENFSIFSENAKTVDIIKIFL
ncbi:MAG: response regulator [Candidatus Sericytochromatia bacterium]